MNAIALVMIVRDEARCLQRCLDSARDWVDEICVLDTGSVDDSPAIAARLGARVAHAAWCDDFSAARNTALDLTRADWRLVLDADEWIRGGAECLAVLRAQPPRHLGLVQVRSVCDAAPGEQQRASSWLPRVLPHGARYTGRVHEQPASMWPRRRLDLCVEHDGYLTEQLARKRGRNRPLLDCALNERPDDAYLLYQSGKDHELAAEYAAAEGRYARAFALAPRAAAWFHDLLLRRLFTLKKLQAFEQAMLLAEAEMGRWDHSPDFFFTIGDLLLDWAAAQPQHAGALLPMIEASWQRALEIGENPQLPDSVLGRGSFLAAHNLGVFFESLGDRAKARFWRERSAQMRADA